MTQGKMKNKLKIKINMKDGTTEILNSTTS